jgi:hypothetical protein
MVARVFVTAVTLLLAAGAFLGAAPIPASPLNPIGILFLTIAGVLWFAWDVIREGFAYGAGSGRDGRKLPLLAGFGPVYIKGITTVQRPDRHSGPARQGRARNP